MCVVTPILLDVLLLQLLVPLKFVLNGTVKGGLWAPIDVWTLVAKMTARQITGFTCF